MVKEYAFEVSETRGRIEHLFIVRMWREGGGDSTTGWRGSVEHTATKGRMYFANLVALTEFMDTCIAAPPYEREAEPPT